MDCLDPIGVEYRALLGDAASRACRYLEALPRRPVRADPEAVALLEKEVGTPLPDAPLPGASVLALLDERGTAATVATAGPRYFGFVTGGALPASVAASWLASAWDQNAFSAASSPAGVLFEAIALGWLRDLLGLPDGCGGALVTGATLANFTGLAAARHRLLAAQGWDVEARGLFGAPPFTVLVGEEAHPTVRKGLGLLGLGRERVVVVPSDAQGRLRAEALPAPGSLGGPVLVCAQAGNVNSGASDPFPALREWCDARREPAWLHVDGAFGLWAAAAPERRARLAGVERADSWATDAHKWLNVPYDSGLAFVRDTQALPAAMSVAASYLPATAAREPMHVTPETSRRARGIEIWAALRSLGRRGVAELVERCCRHAARFAAGLREAGVPVLNDVVLNQVVADLGPRERRDRVVAAIQQDGTCWVGPSDWRGRHAMRISVSGWATGEDDVERSLAAMRRALREEGGACG